MSPKRGMGRPAFLNLSDYTVFYKIECVTGFEIPGRINTSKGLGELGRQEGANRDICPQPIRNLKSQRNSMGSLSLKRIWGYLWGSSACEPCVRYVKPDVGKHALG